MLWQQCKGTIKKFYVMFKQCYIINPNIIMQSLNYHKSVANV